MDSAAIVGLLRERGGAAVVDVPAAGGEHMAVVDRSAIVDILRFCRDDERLAFTMLTDLTAVDYLNYPGREDGPRFEVVYQLYSLQHNHRLRLKICVDEDDAVVPTAVPLWPIANWLEREVWDMFGIRFEGHPDRRRLLLYEEFVGHPLRKDYPVNRRQPLIGPKI
ncbi:MAG TPA: NADH-quinone oxidoreductase subunit C [Methylomirabilota bacterium]|nr:NADH-quinone oxidoreductase subunit C [Methylomirabilota bacterium]